MSKSTVIQDIKSKIIPNGEQDITGQVLQDVLVESVNLVPEKVSELVNDSQYQTKANLDTALATKADKSSLASKQDKLVSGTNIKTINNQSILGSGNISIESGTSITVDSALSTTSENPVQNKVITNTLQTKANASDIPTKVSQLENDSKFATQEAVVQGLATKADKDSLTSLESDITNLQTTVGNQDKSIIANAQAIQGKQDKLVSGTNIKTINNQSLLGSGNISIEGGGSTVVVDDALSDTSENPVQNKVITTRVTSIESSLGSKANASDIPTKVSQLENDSTYQTKANLDTALADYAKTSDVNSKNALQDEAIQSKQDKLISGTNIKTINNQSLLGEGNISIEAGSSITVDSELSTTSENPVQNKVITTKVNSLETSLGSKASQTDLDNLSSTVTTQGQTITSIQTEIGNINTQLTEING